MGSVRLNGSALDAALFGAPTRLGVIVATTTKNNHDTASAFNNTGDALSGKLLVLQPDTACYIGVGSANTQTATTTGLKLEANERFVINMGAAHKFIACLAVSGTTNLQVYELA